MLIDAPLFIGVSKTLTFFKIFGFKALPDGIDIRKVQEVRQVWKVGGSGARGIF